MYTGINERIANLLNNEKHKKNSERNQKALAAALNIPDGTLSRWLSENRDIPAKHIVGICEFFGISEYWLLTGKESNLQLIKNKTDGIEMTTGSDLLVERIKSLMEKSGLNGKQLATVIELPKNAISEWNSGKAKPGTEAIIKIANYFGVTTDYLLTGKEPHQDSINNDVLKNNPSTTFDVKNFVIDEPVIARILDLMEKNEINAKKLTTDLGLSNSSITDWKKRKAKPSYGAIVKIAKYFGVTEEFLLGKTDQPYKEKHFIQENEKNDSLIHMEDIGTEIIECISLVDRIFFLMKKRGVNDKQIISDLGLSNGVVTEWRKGRSRPSTDAIIKIADYFGVTTDYLLTGKESHQDSINNDVLINNPSVTVDDINFVIDVISQFDGSDKMELLGRIRKLARDMKKELAEEGTLTESRKQKEKPRISDKTIREEA